ncbi:AraC family transcriptional regulator [Paenibacillus humicola]|uniref:AraC family transcriptional regulator n=1 Tax=Paenibacillus humicola TaxID=3110540 RepID=UPI00237A9169|nr:AraC family transcriptional regulator [Paenibacillus humicola]
MYLWKESEARLNRFAFRPRSGQAAFNVHYWGIDPNHYSNPVHKHSFFEVCYVLDGEGEYTDDGSEYRLGKGTLFCSRPGIVHQIRSATGLLLIFVAFEMEEQACGEHARESMAALAETETVCIPGGDELPAAMLWKSLLVQAGRPGALPEKLLPELTASLLLSFAELFGGGSEPAAGQRYRPAVSPVLRQAKLYIEDNLGDRDMSLGKVAAYINMSERHLSRLFSDGIRESFTDFVRSRRVRKAAELLLGTELSIQAVADRTGFGSVHYFTRTFGAVMKTTPARFRREGTAESFRIFD